MIFRDYGDTITVTITVTVYSIKQARWIPDQVWDDDEDHAASTGSRVSFNPIALRIDRIVSNPGSGPGQA